MLKQTVLLLIPCLGAMAHAQEPPSADEILRKTSDYMKKLKSFQVSSSSATDFVTKEGQKIQVNAESELSLQRPNRIRANRKGEYADFSLYYDGKVVTVHENQRKFYASREAPGDIASAVEFLREKLHVEVPAADLLSPDLYKSMSEDVITGEYIGKAKIRGQTCHHIAVREKDTDWQLWVRDGAKPLPCKYLIVSKDVAGQPQFEVELYGWKENPKLPKEMFVYKPAKGSERIEFIDQVPQERAGQQVEQKEKGK